MTHISLRDCGAIGDGVADDWDAIAEFCARLAECGGLGIVEPGHYRSTRSGKVNGARVELPPFRIRGNGVRVVGLGNPVIDIPNDYGLYLGSNWVDPDEVGSRARLLATDAFKSTNVITLQSASGYSVGEYIVIYSGSSVNSSGSNIIPLYKQWCKIEAVDDARLILSTALRHDFRVADLARVSGPEEEHAINCVVEGVQIVNRLSSTPYAVMLNSSLNCTLRNVFVDAQSSAGGGSFVDGLVVERCRLRGYNGLGPGRGSGRVTFRETTFEPAGFYQSGHGLHIEETWEECLIENCDILGVGMFAGNSNDTVPAKKLTIRGSRIGGDDGFALRIGGIHNQRGWGLVLENNTFLGSGAVSTDGRATCAIEMRACESLRCVGNSFPDIPIGAVPIYIGEPAVSNMRVSASDNRWHGNGRLIEAHPNISLLPTPIEVQALSSPSGDFSIPAQSLLKTSDRGVFGISPAAFISGGKRDAARKITIATAREAGLLVVSGSASSSVHKTFTLVYAVSRVPSGVGAVAEISKQVHGEFGSTFLEAIEGGKLVIEAPEPVTWSVAMFGASVA